MSQSFDEFRDWIDTETRALLWKEHQKFTVIGTESYSLLLLEYGKDRRRIEDVVAMIREYNPIVLVDYPFVVAQEMTFEDALAGQFALACCDCISAFMRDQVVCHSDQEYLKRINDAVVNSDEYESVIVKILSVPNSEKSRRFCWQFLGLATGLAIPQTVCVYRKKARLMEHWARQSEIELRTEIAT